MPELTRKRTNAQFLLVLSALFSWALAPDALAQSFDLPNVLPDAVNADSSDPVEVIVQVVTLVVRLILWIAVALLALKTILEAVKDIREARDGDTKWVSAGKSIVGGILFFVLILALALWIQGQFLS